MYNIKTINKISPVGLDKLKAKGCNVGEDIAAPDGIIVRSADMHDYEVNPELLGVARAGAGYNNIPIDELAEKGIVVFNSPGANAEAVKEQTVCSMVLASRDVVGSIEWVKSIAGQGDKIPTLVEKGKSISQAPSLWAKPSAFSAWAQRARWSQMPPCAGYGRYRLRSVYVCRGRVETFARCKARRRYRRNIQKL